MLVHSNTISSHRGPACHQALSGVDHIGLGAASVDGRLVVEQGPLQVTVGGQTHHRHRGIGPRGAQMARAQ